jgi:hypothetical protein
LVGYLFQAIACFIFCHRKLTDGQVSGRAKHEYNIEVLLDFYSKIDGTGAVTDSTSFVQGMSSEKTSLFSDLCQKLP